MPYTLNGAKIVFLDIDGVILRTDSPYSNHLFQSNYKLNTAREMLGADLAGWSTNDILAAFDFDPQALGYVKDLCDIFDAEIIVSSNWRPDIEPTESLKRLVNLFKLWGLEKYIKGITPYLNKGHDTEIQLWLDTNEYSDFVILDDIFSDDTPLASQLVLTKSIMNQDDFKKAKAIFNNPLLLGNILKDSETIIKSISNLSTDEININLFITQALYLAITNNRVNLVEYLFALNAQNIGVALRDGKKSLNLAAEYRNVDILEIVLKTYQSLVESMNLKDYHTKSAMIYQSYICTSDNFSLFSIGLIEWLADLYVDNNQEHSALIISRIENIILALLELFPEYIFILLIEISKFQANSPFTFILKQKLLDFIYLTITSDEDSYIKYGIFKHFPYYSNKISDELFIQFSLMHCYFSDFENNDRKIGLELALETKNIAVIKVLSLRYTNFDFFGYDSRVETNWPNTLSSLSNCSNLIFSWLEKECNAEINSELIRFLFVLINAFIYSSDRVYQIIEKILNKKEHRFHSILMEDLIAFINTNILKNLDRFNLFENHQGFANDCIQALSEEEKLKAITEMSSNLSSICKNLTKYFPGQEERLIIKMFDDSKKIREVILKNNYFFEEVKEISPKLILLIIEKMLSSPTLLEEFILTCVRGNNYITKVKNFAETLFNNSARVSILCESNTDISVFAKEIIQNKNKKDIIHSYAKLLLNKFLTLDGFNCKLKFRDIHELNIVIKNYPWCAEVVLPWIYSINPNLLRQNAEILEKKNQSPISYLHTK